MTRSGSFSFDVLADGDLLLTLGHTLSEVAGGSPCRVRFLRQQDGIVRWETARAR